MKNTHLVRIFALFLGLISVAGVLNGMIKTLSNDQLTATSDLIAVGFLKKAHEIGKTPEGLVRVENLFAIEDVLKGTAKAGENIIIETERGFEDEVIFKPDQRVLVFLTPIADADSKRWQVNNLIQGVWPIDADGKLHGMGENETLEGIKATIKRLETQPPKPSATASSPADEAL